MPPEAQRSFSLFSLPSDVSTIDRDDSVPSSLSSSRRISPHGIDTAAATLNGPVEDGATPVVANPFLSFVAPRLPHHMRTYVFILLYLTMFSFILFCILLFSRIVISRIQSVPLSFYS